MELSTISDLFISHIIRRGIFWNKKKKEKGKSVSYKMENLCDHDRKGGGHQSPKTPHGYGDFAIAKEKLN